MKKRLISILLVMALLCACLPRLSLPAAARTQITFARSDAVEIGKTYVIVADGNYALTSRQTGPALREYADDAATTLASQSVTISDGTITGEVAPDLMWTVVESTAPAAYDGMEQYFLRDPGGNYLRRGSGSAGDGAQLLAEPELYSKIRFNTWSFYPCGDGTFVIYANSERSYGSDCPYYLYGNETSFDSPSRLQRDKDDPFAFVSYDDCSRIQLFEAVGYEPCDEHEYEPAVTEPTCSAPGYTTWTCAKCGYSYVSDETYALLHNWPAQGEVTKEPTETERGVLTLTCTRCGATKTRPLAAGNEQAHRNEILFISDLHSGKNAENGYHNLRAMFRLLRQYDGFIPEVVAGGGDYLESRTYDDADWPHTFEVLHDIMYDGSPDTVQVLTAGNHDWEWSRMTEEMLEILLGFPRVCNSYSGEDFEIFQIGAHTNDSPKEEFLSEDIEKLRAFLASVSGSGKVVFIQTHWPLHYGYNSSSWRTTKNADDMIDLLNEYAETLDICFVWGHNHNEDEYRHKCFVPGDELQYSKTESKQIQFTYVNAGCLNERHAKEGAGPEDSYYGPGYLLEARIDGDKLILDYGHITGAWPDPDEAVYDHDADLLYVEEIQEARPSHHEILLQHRSECAHDYQAVVTAPTCTEGGFTTWTCAKCGHAYQDSETAALGHDYKAAVTAPTCTAGGYTTYVCSRCGDSYRADEVDALGHAYSLTGWTWDGYDAAEAVFTCANNPGHVQSVKAEIIPRTSEPTCTVDGVIVYTAAVTFEGAPYTDTVTRVIQHPGHSYTSAVTEPTCTVPGFTVYTCSRCGESYTADETDKLGHDYENGVCTRCGEIDPDYEPPADRSELEEAVDAARALDRDLYTEESLSALDRALSGAVAALADESAGQAAVDAAEQAVRAAIAGLETRPPFRFDDVRDESKYYFDPVYWAYFCVPQITNGLTDTIFGPDNPCTRGQVVTFLWRAAGCPVPEGTEQAFADVSPDAYYSDAVAWAVEAGVTKGMSDSAFAPDVSCTRGQIVTFLWRFNKCPAAARGETVFTDVAAGAFYAEAVAWAVENDVTKGMTETTFAPDAACTRAQVVTFLCRDRNR